MAKSDKKAVGQGIKALLSNIDKKNIRTKAPEKHILTKEEGSLKVSIDYLEPNPWQPRREFDEEKLNELAESIKIHGIIQPIAVRRLNARSYQIISGERRWRAAKSIDLKEIPVNIISADDQTMLEIALLENIQRDDLNPMEVALSYQRLIDECELTHEDLSERLGKKRSSISNHLRLLKLSPSVQDAVRTQSISMGHAKVLAGVERIENQTFLLGEILKNQLSVRATENLIKYEKSSSSRRSDEGRTKDPNLERLEKQLSEHLGTRVSIQYKPSGKGKILIPFSSNDELADITESLID